MIHEAWLRIESGIVDMRPFVGFGKIVQRGEVGLAPAPVLERGEDGEVAAGRGVGSRDDACRERRVGACERYGCRPASADFRKRINQPGRKVAVERIDTGEAVPIVMRRVRARPAQREFDVEAQPLS